MKIYYRPYIVYHKDHDERNTIMIPYRTGIYESKEKAKFDIEDFANSFCSMNTNRWYRTRMVDGFPYVFKGVGCHKVVIAYTNIGEVYAISNEYSYLGFKVIRVGNTFQVYNPSNLLLGIAAIDRDELRALDEALLIIDNNFHTYEYLKSILDLKNIK